MALVVDILSGIGNMASAIKRKIKEEEDIDKNLSEIFGTLFAFDDPLIELKK